MEMVRFMLLAAGIEKRLCAETTTTAVKLLNKCPSSCINGETPDYRWYEKHGDYFGLRIFGCKAFAHIKQGKLDARAVRCVMLGYQDGVKRYRLWCIEPVNPKIVISRDVVFVENAMPLCVAEQMEFSKPSSYNEAMQSKERDIWLKAMIEEI